MNRVFGNMRSPVWESISIPIGRSCGWCEETIIDGDAGIIMDMVNGDGSMNDIVYHRECFLRTIFGSVGHQNGECSCKGGTKEDPEGMSKRQAAQAACELWEKRHVSRN